MNFYERLKAAAIAGSGGGGGGEKPEFYTVTAASGVSSIYGSLVKTGHKATWTGRVEFSSTVSGDKHVFTLPTEVRPYTKYLFKCGTGGSAYDDTGYVLPNGEVHVVLASNKSFVMGDFSWDVITPQYYPVYDTTKVTDSSGGIEVVGNMVIMQVSFTAPNISTGWQQDIFTIPSEVRPSSNQCPFCIYRGRNTAQYPDAWLETNGTFDIYIERNLGTTIDALCIWELPD